MADFIFRFGRLRIVQSALTLMLPGFVHANLEELARVDETHLVAAGTEKSASPDTYKINFKNISIIEYIHFISKITGSNFLFDEGDLQFNVTIVSEEPATIETIFSALIQVLRSNNLNLLEQNGNYLITKSASVAQIPDIISSKADESIKAALSTRVFKISNIKADAIANILKGMVSQKAQVATFAETNQIIITDITTNIDKIASLLAILDAPSSPLEIESYAAKHVSVTELVTLAQQIMAPFTEGNLLLYVPQKETNSIFLISTPHLIERSMTVLEDLDSPAKADLGLPSGTDSIFLYKIEHRPKDEILHAIKTMSSQFQAMNNPPSKLITMLNTARFVPDSNSLVFIGDAASFAKIQEILSTIDTNQMSIYVFQPKVASENQIKVSLDQLAKSLASSATPDTALISTVKGAKYMPETRFFVFSGSQETLTRLEPILKSIDESSSGSSTYFVHRLQNSTFDTLKPAITDFVRNLEAAPNPDHGVIDALKSLRYVKESNSVVFTGDKASLDQVQKVVAEFDSAGGLGAFQANRFFVYSPKYRKVSELMPAIKLMTDHLRSSGLTDPALIRTLETAKPTDNNVVFTGDDHSIQSLQTLLPTIDTPLGPEQAQQLFLYRPINISHVQLEHSLKILSKKLNDGNVSDKRLKDTIASLQWEDASQSIAFSGSSATIDRLKQLISSIDVAPEGGFKHGAYFVYQLKYTTPDDAIAYLNKIAQNLGSSVTHGGVAEVIKNIKVPDANSLLLTGESTAVDQVTKLLEQYDNPASTTAGRNVFIYSPKYIDPKDLLAALSGLITDLSLSDAHLIKTVQTAKVIETNRAIAFSGGAPTLETLKSLIAELDTPGASKTALQKIGARTFFIYKLQHANPTQLQASLKSIAVDLAKGSQEDKDLAETINSMKWIKETNSILFTGTEASLVKLQNQLLPQFDIAALGGPQVPSGPQASFYNTYQPKYVPGEDLIQLLVEFENNLRTSGFNNPSLMSSINNLKYMDKTCTIMITGDPESVQKVEQLLRQFDVASPQQAMIDQSMQLGETSFLIYKLQYHQGDDIRMALRKVASDLQDTHRGQKMPVADAIDAIQWIPVTNSLLTSGPPDVLTKVRDLIQNLDIPLRQVFIEVLILQVGVTNNQTIGVSWSGRGQYRNKFAAQTGNFQGNLPGQTGFMDPLLGSGYNNVGLSTTPSANAFATPTGFDLGAIGDLILHKGTSFISLGSYIDALESDTDSVIITNPKLIAQDSNTATVFYGMNIPFTGSLVTNNAAVVTTSASLEYRNVGNNVSITPTLGSGDLITLDISIDLSSTIGSVASSTPANTVQGITTSQQNIATRVHVPSGWFVCLTGQLTDSKAHARNQIPCLGGLPLIGAAFGSTNRVDSRGHTVIFIRPEIIKTFDDYKRISENQELLLKEVSSLPVLKEELDEGIGWVKTPENE